jgi:hypothetical protein
VCEARLVFGPIKCLNRHMYLNLSRRCFNLSNGSLFRVATHLAHAFAFIRLFRHFLLKICHVTVPVANYESLCF